MLMNSVLKTSGYPKDSEYYNILNKKVLGKMKDELNGFKISDLVGLKSKMYSLISVNNKEVSKAKGINKRLRHEEYLNVLFINKIVNYMRLVLMMFLKYH